MQLIYENKQSEEQILEKSLHYKLDNNFNVEKSKLLFGDNFIGLSYLLNNGYKNKIDLIYIDPPFSTNIDFSSGKNRVSTISSSKKDLLAYTDRLVGEEYLEFLRERLILMKELLSEKGSIYLHIDTKIGHYVKIIMDEVFGKNNFLNEITRIKSNPKNFNRKAYGNQKDVIYFYAKNRGENIWNNITSPLTEEEIKEKFIKKDERGFYNTVPIHAPGESEGPTGKEWKGLFPPVGRHWRVSPDKLTILDDKNLIEWSKTGNPRLKKYSHEHKGKKIQDVWLNFKDPMYPNYPTQKNLDMLDMIVKQSSDTNSIVLDAFAGSGGTLNMANKNGRIFIGIDQSEISLSVIKENLTKASYDEINLSHLSN